MSLLRMKNLPTMICQYVFPKDKHMREIVFGSGISFGMKLTGAGLSFAFNALLARLYGAEGAGLYFLALSVATLSVTFGKVGLDNTLLRYVASNAAVNDWSTVKSVYKKGFAVAISLASLVTVVVFFLSPFFAETIFRKESVALPIKYIAFGIIPVVLLTLYGELLKGLKKIFFSQFVQGVGFQVLCFIGLYFGSKFYPSDSIIAVLSYVLSAWVMAVVGYIIWGFNLPKVKERSDSFTYKMLMDSALPLFFVSTLSLSYNWINTFLLGVWGSKADVGVFSLAFRTAMLISFILVAVNTISAPKFAEIYKSGNLDLLAETARKTLRFMILLSTPILIIFLVYAEEIMGVFGEEFKVGSTTLIILSIAQYVNVIAGSVGYLLMMTGNEIQVRNSNFISAVLCLFMSIFLVPNYGYLGAGISMSSALILRNMIEIYLVWKYLGIVLVDLNKIGIVRYYIRRYIS